MSSQIDQTKIDLAEADVTRAYLVPLGLNYDTVQEDVRATIMALAFLCVLQRSSFATRAGAKDKTSAQSVQADKWNLLEQWAEPCKMRLHALAKAQGVCKPWRVVHDICGLYYNTHFIGL